MDDNNILNDRWDYLRKKYIHEYRTGNFHVKDNNMFSEIMDSLYYHYLMLKWYRGVLKDTLIEIDGILKKINDKLH